MFSMHVFDVTIQRTDVREHTFRIEADTIEEAKIAAFGVANKFDFKDGTHCDAGLEVTTIKRVE